MIPRCKFLHNLSCEQVSNRIIELEDENARLRSCLSDDKENARLVFGEYHLLVEENAKLRAERDYLLANSNPTAAELRRVRSAWKNDRDENAKLRELVRDMWDVALHPQLFGDGSYLLRRMRDLGIEVDG